MSPRQKEAPLLYLIETFRLRPHAIENFDILRIEEGVQHLGREFKPHRHDCIIFYFITEGTGRHTVDFETYDVEPNTVFLLTPGEIHSFELSPDIAGFAVYFRLEFYLHYPRDRHFDKIPLFRVINPQTYLKSDKEKLTPLITILEEMMEESTQNLKANEEVLRNLLDILLIRVNRLWQNTNPIEGTMVATVQIRTLIILVAENYATGKSAGDYAAMMKVTLNYLNKLCKQSINCTVTELIHNRVLLESKRLLAYSDYPVKKIASSLGYRDTSYFLRLFKKKVGITADTFRERYTISNS